MLRIRILSATCLCCFRNTSYEYSVLRQYDVEPEEDTFDFSVNLDSLVNDSSSDEDSDFNKRVDEDQNAVRYFKSNLEIYVILFEFAFRYLGLYRNF